VKRALVALVNDIDMGSTLLDDPPQSEISSAATTADDNPAAVQTPAVVSLMDTYFMEESLGGSVAH